jgi:O-antigen/teichoic acid export membrane protein
MIKLAGFFLIPLYTNPSYLSAADFGLFGIIDVSLTIVTEVLTLGQANSVLMFNNSEEYKEKKHSSFFTVVVFTSVLSFAFFVLILTFSSTVSSLFSNPEKYNVYLKWCGSIILFRIINNILLSKLRADEKSSRYTLINVSKTLVMLGFTIYFLTVSKLEVLGILYASLLAELVAFLLMLPTVVKFFVGSGAIKFDKDIMWVGIKFGLPLVLATIGSMLLNVSDRYILKIFTNFKTVAIYDLGYRIAGVINMFVILPFSFTLLPNAFNVSGKTGDKRYFSKLLTYLTFVLVWLGLAQSFFAEEFIMFFTTDPIYASSYQVVSIITFSYIFSGMRSVSTIGFYLTKKTGYIAVMILFAALLNIILNVIFIPIYGMITAAYTTLIAFLLLYLFSQIISNKRYYIPFENFKLVKILLCGVILFLAVTVLGNDDFVLKLVLKVAALLLFPLILFLLKFYEVREIKSLKGFYKKWKDPKKWFENIVGLNLNDEN